MPYSELIHRYFDEGLEGSLEDVLFEQLARDQELRREFAEHARIASLVRADADHLTPPSQLTATLFADLGLAPAAPATEAVHAVPPGAHVRIPVSERMRATLHAWLPQLRTAAFASVATAILLLVLLPRIGPDSIVPGMVTDTADGDRAIAGMAPRTTPASVAVEPVESRKPAAHQGARVMAAPVSDPAAVDEHAVVSEADLAVAGADASVAGADASGSPTFSFRVEGRLSSTGENDMRDERIHAGTDAHLSYSVALMRPGWLPMSDSAAHYTLEALRDPRPAFPSSTRLIAHDVHAAATTAPSERPRTALDRITTSHVLVEMRLMNGTSDPDVDLPAPGNALFRDLAISAVYAVSTQHAVGVEYGRESFGQVYTSTDVRTPSSPSVRGIVNTSAPWLPVVYNENRTLDWVGAVWKLSFADMALFDAVFPYARTVLGATKDGPLGKFRMGLEYTPWPYTLVNAGVEGTLLRYTVEGAWYQTTKLGVTIGLAVGF